MVPFLIFIFCAANLALLVKHRLKRRKKKLQRQNNEIWSIGIYEGTNPLTFTPALGITNPILTAHDVTDAEALFVADPFMIEHNGEYHLFFELLNKKQNKGEIGHAFSCDLKTWKYTGIVLKEKFHLSYPYVFNYDDNVYMIPESAKSKSVRLYKAVSFPRIWEPVATILKGNKRSTPLLDPSILFHNDHWYLFTYTRKGHNLHLFIANTLTGPWKEHPKSPVISGNDHFARPGGRIIKDDDIIYRYAQDGFPHYGSKVWGFRITELTPKTFREEQHPGEPVIQAGNELWNNSGMHTVDPHKMNSGHWIAIVDGLENINKRQQQHPI